MERKNTSCCSMVTTDRFRMKHSWFDLKMGGGYFAESLVVFASRGSTNGCGGHIHFVNTQCYVTMMKIQCQLSQNNWRFHVCILYGANNCIGSTMCQKMKLQASSSWEALGRNICS